MLMEAVIKKYGYSKEEFLKMTIKRYGRKRIILFLTKEEFF
jgi:hypothetical protein